MQTTIFREWPRFETLSITGNSSKVLGIQPPHSLHTILNSDQVVVFLCSVNSSLVICFSVWYSRSIQNVLDLGSRKLAGHESLSTKGLFTYSCHFTKPVLIIKMSPWRDSVPWNFRTSSISETGILCVLIAEGGVWPGFLCSHHRSWELCQPLTSFLMPGNIIHTQSTSIPRLTMPPRLHISVFTILAWVTSFPSTEVWPLTVNSIPWSVSSFFRCCTVVEKGLLLQSPLKLKETFGQISDGSW